MRKYTWIIVNTSINKLDRRELRISANFYGCFSSRVDQFLWRIIADESDSQRFLRGAITSSLQALPGLSDV